MAKKGRPQVKKPPLVKKKSSRKIIQPKVQKPGRQQSAQGIAYEIKDANFGIFKVRNTANAWWKDKRKVELVLSACRADATVLEICFNAGITEGQYRYFVEVHPEFLQVKMVLSQYPVFRARSTWVNSLDDPIHAKDYLAAKKKDEFSKRNELTGANGTSLFDDYRKLSDEELEAEIAKRNDAVS